MNRKQELFEAGELFCFKGKTEVYKAERTPYDRFCIFENEETEMPEKFKFIAWARFEGEKIVFISKLVGKRIYVEKRVEDLDFEAPTRKPY